MLPLEPAFDPETYAYTVDVGFLTSIEVYATAEENVNISAQYEYNGNWQDYTLGRGILSQTGYVNFRITAAFAGGAEQTYTIEVDLGGN